eukprot:CAMPEP_0194397284 /NCGR_PEP_ID=MMETSP0174-20130528/125462_1 /TAXON_ID=216777 /ORGANISM="Proboscia alata, Strain PI-D3" /LENGTH=147 /DNA_ID=CAMNT_0039193451 /DNA_START=319 /DNA_END=759 /DNA_ORIENTATION=+
MTVRNNQSTQNKISPLPIVSTKKSTILLEKYYTTFSSKRMQNAFQSRLARENAEREKSREEQMKRNEERAFVKTMEKLQSAHTPLAITAPKNFMVIVASAVADLQQKKENEESELKKEALSDIITSSTKLEAETKSEGGSNILNQHN